MNRLRTVRTKLTHGPSMTREEPNATWLISTYDKTYVLTERRQYETKKNNVPDGLHGTVGPQIEPTE